MLAIMMYWEMIEDLVLIVNNKQGTKHGTQKLWDFIPLLTNLLSSFIDSFYTYYIAYKYLLYAKHCVRFCI